MIYCPICKQYFSASIYLAETFAKDPGTEWLANMVTHYRHQHRAYDRWIGYVERKKHIPYERQKTEINEQAKRQIARKCKDYMIVNHIGLENLMQLQYRDEKTYALYAKLFGGSYPTVSRVSKNESGCPYGAYGNLNQVCVNCSKSDCDARACEFAPARTAFATEEVSEP